jgi:predicted pPIWI-associating nuclease
VAQREDFGAWDSMWERIDAFAAVLSRHKAQNVNAAGLRHEARDIVKDYFRGVKPALHRLGVSDSTLAELDSQMQRLIGLSTGRNSKSSYRGVVQRARAERKKVETGLEFLIGAESVTPANRPQPAGVEAAILRTLGTLLPAAAASYEQVLRDLQDTGRASYRGVAADLREVVREILDHLAPDADVMGSPGFKLEQGQKGPTMRQKVNFILRARKVGDSARQTALESIEHVNENAGLVGRAVYSRGAADVHSARPREEVLNFKGYADALLAELLEVHKSAQAAPDSSQIGKMAVRFVLRPGTEKSHRPVQLADLLDVQKRT